MTALVVGGLLAGALLAVAAALRVVPMKPVLLLLLGLRIIVDGFSKDTRDSSSVNISALISMALIMIALGYFFGPQRAGRPLILPATFVGLWTAIAVLNYGVAPVVWREGVREISILAVATIALGLAREGASRWFFAKSAVWLVLISTLVALYEMATGTGTVVADAVRADGLFGHPNSAAPVFGLVLILCVALVEARAGLRYVVLAVLTGTALLGTASLTSLIATSVSFAVYVMLRKGSLRRNLAFLASGVVILTVFLLSPAGQARLEEQSKFSLESARTQGSHTGSLSWRLYNWSTLIEDWKHKPWFGEGLGATTTGRTATGTIPHNEYLRYLVETGVVGLALILAAGVYLIYKLTKQRAKESHRPGPELAVISIVIGLLVHAIAANTVLTTVLMYLLAMLVGGVLASRVEPDSSEAGSASGHRPLSSHGWRSRFSPRVESSPEPS